jgi:hypothetical protein
MTGFDGELTCLNHEFGIELIANITEERDTILSATRSYMI